MKTQIRATVAIVVGLTTGIILYPLLRYTDITTDKTGDAAMSVMGAGLATVAVNDELKRLRR